MAHAMVQEITWLQRQSGLAARNGLAQVDINVSTPHIPPFQGKAASSTAKAKKVPLATSSTQVGFPPKALALRFCVTRNSL